jgi:thermitase
MSIFQRKWTAWVLAGWVMAAWALPAQALFFRIEGDRLWLQADRTPMREVLLEFARAGVAVRMDPRASSPVTASFRGEPLDKAMGRLLEGYDYLLAWRTLRGPLGQVPKLDEIQVYLPGEPSAARALEKPGGRFEATRGVGGGSPEFVKDELLVGVRPGTTYEEFRRLLDQVGGMIAEADAATGIYLIRFAPGTNVEALLGQLGRHGSVAHAELNWVTRLPGGDRAGGGLPGVPEAKKPADGSTPVAVLDSGLDPGAGLGEVVSAAWDAVEPERSVSDALGHGTQMAFLASGVVQADGASAGDALPVVAVRAFDEEGKTSNFAIVQALAFAAQAGAKVVNMSWGSETDSAFMRRAMEVAAERGLILVAAAGNAATGRPTYPAAYPTVLGVGGVTADGAAWEKSNFGDFVSLSAPATASIPVGHEGPPGAYAGTSISSAVAANALAQYVNRNPEATPAAAWAALQGALSPGPPGHGAGVLDAAALARFLGE